MPTRCTDPGDAYPGLADLVGMRAPAQARDRPRAANGRRPGARPTPRARRSPRRCRRRGRLRPRPGQRLERHGPCRRLERPSRAPGIRRSESVGVNPMTSRSSADRVLFRRNGVGRDGQRCTAPSRAASSSRLPAQPQACDEERIAGLDGRAVGGQRQVGPGGDVGHRLVSRSLPAATTAAAPAAVMSWTMLSAQASGAYSSRHSCSTTCAVDTPCAPSRCPQGCLPLRRPRPRGAARRALGQAAAERERLERQLVSSAALGFDQAEEHVRPAPAPAAPQELGAPPPDRIRGSHVLLAAPRGPRGGPCGGAVAGPLGRDVAR